MNALRHLGNTVLRLLEGWQIMSGKLKDLTGQVFGRLTVESFSHMNGKHSYWNCRCECGNIHIVRSDCLKGGLVKSCGCLNREPRGITHGQSKTKLYHVWAGIKQRCNNPNANHYDRYGGRGITYCKEWEKYEPFYTWAMNNGYQEGLTIDRIDNDGNYEPTNCRWITIAEQQRNKCQRKSADYYKSKV